MAGIAYRYSGSVRSLTGAAYTNPTAGTYRLNVRTGSGSNDIMKFGLTTNTSASAYSPKMLINGNVCYIGRTEGGTASSTRSSSYVSEYRTATRKSTSNTTWRIYEGQCENWAYARSGGGGGDLWAGIDLNYNQDYTAGGGAYSKYTVQDQLMLKRTFVGRTNNTWKTNYYSYYNNYGYKTVTGGNPVGCISMKYIYPSITSNSYYMTNSITFNSSNHNSTALATSVDEVWNSRRSTGYDLYYDYYSFTHLGYYANYGNLVVNIAHQIECDGEEYMPSGFDAHVYVSLPITSGYVTRTSKYTTATITATRSSSYTYENTTHNYNI